MDYSLFAPEYIIKWYMVAIIQLQRYWKQRYSNTVSLHLCFDTQFPSWKYFDQSVPNNNNLWKTLILIIMSDGLLAQVAPGPV